MKHEPTMEGSYTVIDETEFAAGEAVEQGLDEIVNARAQAPTSETLIEQALNERAERKRRRRRAVNNDLWQQHHLGIAESLRALAAEQERKAASLAEGE
jgi:hypothetical protein